MRYSIKNVIKSKEARYFFSFAIGGIIQFVFGYALTFVSNYVLDKAGVGKFNYYFNFANLVVNLMSFGLYASYIRIIGEGFDDALRKLVLSFYILISLIYFIICCLTGLYFMIPFAFLLFFNERQYYYRSHENTFFYLLGQILRGVTLILGIGIFYYFKTISYKTLMITVGGSYFFSSVIFFILRSNKGQSNLEDNTGVLFSPKLLKQVDLKKMFSISIPTQFTSMATWLLLFSDQYIIKMYYSFEELGPYSVGMRLVVFLNIISGLFLLYYPKFYFKSIKSLQFAKIKMVRWTFFAVLFFMMLILVIFRAYFYQILGAAKFINYSIFFVYLVLAEAFRICGSINFTFLSFIYKTKYSTYSIIFISALNIALNLLFIQKIGIVFAAYSTLICCFIYFVISYVVAIRMESRYIKLHVVNAS